jgi:hypothetical protein
MISIRLASHLDMETIRFLEPSTSARRKTNVSTAMDA